MAMIVAATIIARSAAVGLGAPSVDVAAVPVAADDHADLVDGTATGTAAMGDTPGGGGMPPSGFGRGGSEDHKTYDEGEQGNKFLHDLGVVSGWVAREAASRFPTENAPGLFSKSFSFLIR